MNVNTKNAINPKRGIVCKQNREGAQKRITVNLACTPPTCEVITKIWIKPNQPIASREIMPLKS